MEFLTTPQAFGYLVSLLALIVGYFISKQNDKVQRIKGYVLQGMKLVEKAIPDDTENKALKKIDLFCETFGQNFINGEGKFPTKKVTAKALALLELYLHEKDLLGVKK